MSVLCTQKNLEISDMTAFDTEDLRTELSTILDDKLEKPMENSSVEKTNIKEEVNGLSRQVLNSDLIPRPRTLEDFKNQENFENCDEESSFTFNGLDSDEELWLIDIPRTVDPLHLNGLTINVGDKSKFKIKEDTYCAISKDVEPRFTCVFQTDNESAKYKTVNIKPHKMLKIRRKLSSISKKKIEVQKPQGVPYPKNIKQRHPFFGVQEFS